MRIDLSPLGYTFQQKPLLVGGMAMEYYHLRSAGADIDFVVAPDDYDSLARHHPGDLRDLFGDLGVCVANLELWRTILRFGYDFLARDAIEEQELKVIALDRLLFLKALAINEPKYDNDVRLIVAKIQSIQYGKDPDYPADFFARGGQEVPSS